MKATPPTDLLEADAQPPGPPDDENPRDLPAAPLRDAPRFERVARIVLTVLALAFGLLSFYADLSRPRVVEFGGQEVPYRRLLADAAEGRVERVEIRRNQPPRWRNRDGAAYEFRRYVPDADVRAQVEAQPYVRDNPGSVTYGRVGVLEVMKSGPATLLGGLFWLFLLVVLVRGPRPRRATRWGWFWLFGAPLGLEAYLLLSGSWTRAARPGDQSPRRVVGGVAFAIALLVGVAWMLAMREVHDARHPLRNPHRVVVQVPPA